MPRSPQTHPIWGTYQLLTKDLGIERDDALARLRELTPTMPVDVIIEAQGDIGRTFELLTGTPPPVRPDTGKPDPRAVTNRLREAIANGQGQEADPNDFNAMIRARAVGLDRSVTVDSSDPAAAYDPEQDFIRQRFAERTG